VPSHWGLSGYNIESMAVDHSGKSVWRVLLSQHIKDLFCWYQKQYTHFSGYRQRFVDPQLSVLFQWRSEV
jgi:hypothetical protein